MSRILLYENAASGNCHKVRERTAAGHAALAVMERHLERRQFFVGNTMSIADICLYGYTHVASEGGFELEPYSAVRSWIERLESAHGVVPISGLE